MVELSRRTVEATVSYLYRRIADQKHKGRLDSAPIIVRTGDLQIVVAMAAKLIRKTKAEEAKRKRGRTK